MSRNKREGRYAGHFIRHVRYGKSVPCAGFGKAPNHCIAAWCWDDKE